MRSQIAVFIFSMLHSRLKNHLWVYLLVSIFCALHHELVPYGRFFLLSQVVVVVVYSVCFERPYSKKNPHVLNISRLRKKKPQKIPGAKLPMSLSGIVSKLTNSVSVFGYKNYKMASGTNFGSMQKIALVCQIPAQNRQNSFVVQKTVSYKVVSILKNFKVMFIF